MALHLVDLIMGTEGVVDFAGGEGWGQLHRCRHRQPGIWLQTGAEGAEVNNLFDHAIRALPSRIDLAKHAGAMGAVAVKTGAIAALEGRRAGHVENQMSQRAD